MEDQSHNQPPSYGTTPHVDPAPTHVANPADVVATPAQEDVAPQGDAQQTVATPVDSPTPPPLDEGRHTLTVGDAVRMGRERGYERTPRKWQEDSKRGIVDAVKRRVGDQEAWFMNEASVRTRLDGLVDRAAAQRTSPTPPSPRPVVPTDTDQAQRPSQEDAPPSRVTGADRRVSVDDLDELDPFDMPDDPQLLKRYVGKVRGRLEFAKFKEEQLVDSLAEKRDELKSMREFLGGERGIVRVMSDAMSKLGLGSGRREEHNGE